MLRTIQRNAASTTQSVIRVKGGDLAPKGKGTLTISVMPDRKVVLRATLPSENGGQKPFDLTSLARLELVRTRNGIYKGRQWIEPVVVTSIAFFAVPTVIEIVDPVLRSFLYHFIPFRYNPFTFHGLFVHTSLVGSTYAAGLYAGGKLNRVARFVATTDDGRHCVAEMSEAAFRFVQGIKAAENLYMEKEAADSAANADVKGTTPSLT